MQLLVNDRFLNRHQDIKIAVIDDATDQGASSANSSTINVDFELFDDNWQPQQVSIETVGRYPARKGVPVFPTAARKIQGSVLKPGLYHLRASKEAVLVGSQDLVILSDDDYQRILKSILAEEMPSSTDRFDLTRTWKRTWSQVLDYLGVSSVPHIAMTTSLPPRSAPYNEMLYDLGQYSFEWAAFHLNRLIFDRAVFGAKVTVLQGQNSTGNVSVRVLSAFHQAPLRKVPQYISQLVSSVSVGNYFTEMSMTSKDGEDYFILNSSPIHG